MQKHWFVMRDFKPWNAKNPAYKTIGNLGIRYFTPMHWIETVNTKGRKESVYIPVVPNLLFVNECRSILDPVVEKTARFQYLFRRGSGQATPMTIPEDEMERFITAVGTDESPVYFNEGELTPDKIGKNVLVTGGSLEGYKGNLLKTRGTKRNRLIVRIRNFLAAAVEVTPDCIQVLS